MAKFLNRSNATNVEKSPVMVLHSFEIILIARQSRKVKELLVDRVLKGSGIPDTARVLPVSNSTIIKELKKRNRNKAI